MQQIMLHVKSPYDLQKAAEKNVLKYVSARDTI